MSDKGFDELRKELMGKLASEGGLKQTFKSTRQYEKELNKVKKESLVDPLTGLKNRKALLEDLSKANYQLQRGMEGYAVIYLDADHFKEVNDVYGHFVGDQLLKKLGQALVNSVRASDTVYRDHGDEFAILLSGYERENGLQMIKEKFSERFAEELVSLRSDPRYSKINMSLGIVIPEENEDSESVLKRVDSLMYQNKQQKKNR